MARLVTLEAPRTYATEKNAIAAVEKKFPESGRDGLRYFIYRNAEGRYFPAFIGYEAVHKGVHFHFNVVA
jgi:hypothetical protein